MKGIARIMVLFSIMTVQGMGAGYSVFMNDDPGRFIEGVRSNKRKYSKVLIDETKGGVKTYVYRLDFQLIAQIAGENHIATVTGPVSKPEEMKAKIVEARREIILLEGRGGYVKTPSSVGNHRI